VGGASPAGISLNYRSTGDVKSKGRRMIFRRTLLREFATTAAGVFVVLVAITLTTQFIR
jgi:hypothetical protein